MSLTRCQTTCFVWKSMLVKEMKEYCNWLTNCEWVTSMNISCLGWGLSGGKWNKFLHSSIYNLLDCRHSVRWVVSIVFNGKQEHHEWSSKNTQPTLFKMSGAKPERLRYGLILLIKKKKKKGRICSSLCSCDAFMQLSRLEACLFFYTCGSYFDNNIGPH